MKKFFKKIGDRLSALGVTLKIFWRSLEEIFKEFWKDYKPNFKFYTGFISLLFAFFLVLAIIIFPIGYHVQKLTDERELMVLTALYQKVKDEKANRAVEDLKIILSNDKTSLEVLEATRDLESIDGGYYFEKYLNPDLDVLSLMNGKISADQIVKSIDEIGFWNLAWQGIKYFMIIYPSGLACFYLIAVYETIKIKWWKLKNERKDGIDVV